MLREARSAEQRCLQRLAVLEPQREALVELVAAGPHPGGRVAELRAAHRQNLHHAEEARWRAEAAGAAVSADAERIRAELVHAWHAQRGDAAASARVLWAEPGRFGLHRGAHSRAAEALSAWAKTWRPLLPAMPTDPQRIAEIAGRSDYPLHPGEAFAAAGRTQAEAAHPEHAALVAAATAAKNAADRAWAALDDARREDADRAARFGRLADLPDPAARLADTQRDLAATGAELATAQGRIATSRPSPPTATDRPTRPPTSLSASPPARAPAPVSTGTASARQRRRRPPRTRSSTTRGRKTSATCSPVSAPAAGSPGEPAT